MAEQSIRPPHDGILFQKIYGDSAHLRSQDSWHRYVPAGTNESIPMGVRHDTPGRSHSASSCTCKAPQRPGRIQKRGRTDSSDVKTLREENAFLHAAGSRQHGDGSPVQQAFSNCDCGVDMSPCSSSSDDVVHQAASGLREIAAAMPSAAISKTM